MSKARKGDIIFQRGKNNEDIWDDSVLIEAYEEAVSLAYDSVRANLQSNGEYSAEELTKHGLDTRKSRERNDSVDNSSANEAANTSASRKKSKSTKKKWQVGDRCLARYTEDGNLYEAEIIAIDRSHNRCSVRYTEYGNEEDVNLGVLDRLPESSMDEEESNASDRDEDGNFGDVSDEATQSQAAFEYGQVGFNTVPLLPPPMPPHLLRQHDGVPQEDEAMASMLMSWYTSGYHTGYYQAVRDMKKMKK